MLFNRVNNAIWGSIVWRMISNILNIVSKCRSSSHKYIYISRERVKYHKNFCRKNFINGFHSDRQLLPTSVCLKFEIFLNHPKEDSRFSTDSCFLWIHSYQFIKSDFRTCLAEKSLQKLISRYSVRFRFVCKITFVAWSRESQWYDWESQEYATPRGVWFRVKRHVLFDKDQSPCARRGNHRGIFDGRENSSAGNDI